MRINLLEGIVEMTLDFWREPERQALLGVFQWGFLKGRFVVSELVYIYIYDII